METLITAVAVLVLFVGPVIALALAALRYGADSRLSITDGATRWI